MTFIGFDLPDPVVLKGYGDAASRNLEFRDYIIALIQAQGKAIPVTEDLPNATEQDAMQVADSILHMALRRDPDDKNGFFLVEELYSILYGETSWKKRSTGNRIQIGKMFGKLVANPNSALEIDGQVRQIFPAGKTPQNQAKYRTVATDIPPDSEYE